MLTIQKATGFASFRERAMRDMTTKDTPLDHIVEQVELATNCRVLHRLPLRNHRTCGAAPGGIAIFRMPRLPRSVLSVMLSG